MLESMHRHMKWIMWVIVGLVTVTFVFTFGNYPTGSEGRVAATVNGDTVTLDELNRVYQNLHDTYRGMLKEQFNETLAKSLRAQALNELISHRLLVQEAKRRGLRVSDDELRATIVKIPVFSYQGRFDQRAYERYLDRFNLAPAAFEENQREYLLRKKLEQLIEDSVDATDAELSSLYQARNPKAKPGDFAKNRTAFRQTALAEKRNAALDGYVKGLHAAATIQVNRNILAPE